MRLAVFVWSGPTMATIASKMERLDHLTKQGQLTTVGFMKMCWSPSKVPVGMKSLLPRLRSSNRSEGSYLVSALRLDACKHGLKLPVTYWRTCGKRTPS
jgi:hypothetical protein